MVHQFGINHEVPELAEVVMSLFHAALQPSSQRTYRTGQRAYNRFLGTMRGGRRFPFRRRFLPETELNLAFFIAFLLLQPSISKASTILSYYETREILVQDGRMSRGVVKDTVLRANKKRP